MTTTETDFDALVARGAAFADAAAAVLATVTPPSCPDWCGMPPGHPYDAGGSDGAGGVRGSRWHKRATVSGDWEIEQFETYDVATGALDLSDGIHVPVEAEIDFDDPDELRYFADTLQAASEELRAVTA